MTLFKSRLKATFLFLFVCPACGNKVVSAKLPESFAVTNSEMDVATLTRLEQFGEHENRLVKITGVAVRMKAGSAIELNDGLVWCPNSDWEDVAGKMVLATGILSKGGSLMAEVPVAKQDEDGNWSQGVSEPPSLAPKPDPLQMTTATPPHNDSEHVQPKVSRTASASWHLTVRDFEVDEQ